jgi:two-component system NarL family sensor kinase
VLKSGSSGVGPAQHVIEPDGPAPRVGTGLIFPFLIGGSDLSLGQDPAIDELVGQALDALTFQIGILDASGRLRVANSAWKRAAKANGPGSGDDTDRGGVLGFLTSDDEHAEWLSRTVSRVLAGKSNGAKLSFAAAHRKRRRRFKLRVAPVSLGGRRGAVIVNEDVTEIYELNREKRRLSDQLIHSEEHERRRIAREMHDSTAQDLVAIGLNLRRLAKLNGDSDTREALADIHAILARTQRDVRTMSYLLHPPLLDEGGLVLALSSLIQGLSNRMNLRIEFHTDVGEERLATEAEMVLYRVAQEALINVHKHASATYAVVRYSREPDQLVLHIEDDGIGIGRRHAGVEAGVGIPGMRARLRRLGGELTLSHREVGTILKATVPIGALLPN